MSDDLEEWYWNTTKTKPPEFRQLRTFREPPRRYLWKVAVFAFMVALGILIVWVKP